MKNSMKDLKKKVLPVADIMLMPLVYPAAWLLKNIRKAGVHRLPLCKSALMKVGVFPIRDHYYEPQFDNRNPRPDFSQDRNLQGINWNIPGQLKMLGLFSYSQELLGLQKAKQGSLEFYLNNGAFESGDADIGIRSFAPLNQREYLRLVAATPLYWQLRPSTRIMRGIQVTNASMFALNLMKCLGLRRPEYL
jgi:hypothetical protein